MTEETWNRLGAAALGVGVVFGLMPILPDPARIAALGVALGLAVAAFVVRRRVRSAADREGLDAHGAGAGSLDSPAAWRQSNRIGQLPDQRHDSGFGGSSL
jgi:hypothetical protein